MDNEDYLLTVEQFVLSLKESGLSLSATDYDLIQQWETRGVPVQLVCRGIENGFFKFESTSPRQPTRFNLSYLKAFIEEEIERGWKKKYNKQ